MNRAPLRIAVTSHYLDATDCHRGFTAQFDDFELGSALRRIKDLPAAWSRKFLEQVWVLFLFLLQGILTCSVSYFFLFSFYPIR